MNEPNQDNLNKAIDDPSVPIIGIDEFGEKWQYFIPIDNKKIYVDNINENQNFERGVNEPADLGLGKWKEPNDEDYGKTRGMKISIEEFLENGGLLKKGREIWRLDGNNKWPEGEYIRFDEDQKVHLISSGRFKSLPIVTGDFGVKVKTRVFYK